MADLGLPPIRAGASIRLVTKLPFNEQAQPRYVPASATAVCQASRCPPKDEQASSKQATGYEVEETAY